jgi:hypothetical protein
MTLPGGRVIVLFGSCHNGAPIRQDFPGIESRFWFLPFTGKSGDPLPGHTLTRHCRN